MEEGLGRIPEFAPDFAERLFGEEGKIFGYKDLKVVDENFVKCRPFIYFTVSCELSDWFADYHLVSCSFVLCSCGDPA